MNKTYVAELQNHNKLKLEGTYTVNSDGSLIPVDENTDFNEDDYDSLDVQVSGTIPSSGELTYENNVLKSGYLVIGDYRVTFNSDGTVTTVKNTGLPSTDTVNSGSESGSNSSTPVEYGFKSIDEMTIGTSGYTLTGKKTYLKYNLTDGEVEEETVPEVCIYSETYLQKELCLKINEFDTSIEKTKTYFGYTTEGENAWTNTSGSEWENPAETISCDFSASGFSCSDSDVYVQGEDSGVVNTVDYSEYIFCGVSNTGSSYCYVSY